MAIQGAGCVVRVTTIAPTGVAEALCFVPGATINTDEQGRRTLDLAVGEVSVGEVSVGEGGTFAGSAREINSAVDSRLGMHVGEAIANLTPAEIR